MRYIIALLFFSQITFAQLNKFKPSIALETKEAAWVDSIYNKMTLEEKI